jgi:flagellar basal-body rod modification protein FlgD
VTIPAVESGNVPAWANTPESTVQNTAMDKDTFLKLMVAQLKYQDPSKPADSSAFIAQTAQFTQVEKMDELVKQNAQMLLSQRTLSAGVLVGTHVTYMDADGVTQSGTVDSVRINPVSMVGGKEVAGSTEPVAMVGGKEVPLGRIQSLSAATAASPPPAVATP